MCTSFVAAKFLFKTYLFCSLMVTARTSVRIGELNLYKDLCQCSLSNPKNDQRPNAFRIFMKLSELDEQNTESPCDAKVSLL